ncbi:hypothetical protein BDR26DRAFT_850163 [Obelidium mucronatum]|nr:hypothetical protein BDR26DRAFT_850163 [Obelidium mucronatum]
MECTLGSLCSSLSSPAVAQYIPPTDISSKSPGLVFVIPEVDPIISIFVSYLDKVNVPLEVFTQKKKRRGLDQLRRFYFVLPKFEFTTSTAVDFRLSYTVCKGDVAQGKCIGPSTTTSTQTRTSTVAPAKSSTAIMTTTTTAEFPAATSEANLVINCSGNCHICLTYGSNFVRQQCNQNEISAPLFGNTMTPMSTVRMTSSNPLKVHMAQDSFVESVLVHVCIAVESEIIARICDSTSANSIPAYVPVGLSDYEKSGIVSYVDATTDASIHSESTSTSVVSDYMRTPAASVNGITENTMNPSRIGSKPESAPKKAIFVVGSSANKISIAAPLLWAVLSIVF